MHAIYVDAIIVTVMGLAVFSLVIWRLVPRELRWPMVGLFLMELPMQPLALYYVRLPIHGVLKGALMPEHETALEWISLFYAPVTEELAKLLPVAIYLMIRPNGKSDWRAMIGAIGFGFGIGEAWMIAQSQAGNPALAQYTWYQLMGYVSERFMVCFVHGGMTCAGLSFTLGRGRWILGTLLAMGLHLAMNAPIYVLGPKQLKLPPTAFSIVLQLWVVLAFLLSLGFLLGKDGAARFGKFMFGQAECPRCHVVYDRNLWAANVGLRRYEKCPACKTWNWTKRKEEELKI